MTDTIKNFPNRLHRMTQVFYREVPSQVAARRFVDSLVNLLFPVRDRRGMSLKEMDLRWENLQQDFLHIITPLCSGMDCCCERLTARFFAEIPLIYAGLMKDANLYKSCDPAAYCTEEVILCYPGFYAVMVYRLSHVMHRLDIPVLPRVVSEYAHSQTGIDIHPGATIGPRFYIDHGTGIVIGETAEIGDDCLLYHGVTLGGTGKDHGKRHPTLGNNVMVSAGAKVLGPFKVGDNSRIAANAVVLSEIPPEATAVGVPARVVRIAGEKVDFAGQVDQIHVTDPVQKELQALNSRLEWLEQLMDEQARSKNL
mgnify:FL=1